MQAIRPLALRAPARQVRTLHTVRRTALPRTAFRTTRRNASTTPSISEPAKTGAGGGALTGALAGAASALVVGYIFYRTSGAATAVDYAHKTKSQLDSAFKSATEAAPKPNEAIKWLRETVHSYSKFIPGADQYVDQAFADLDKISQKHDKELQDIVSKAYEELKDVTKGGASLAAAGQAAQVLQRAMKELAKLGKDAAGDVLDNHPEVKEKIGGQYKQLQQMAENYGPEAKKEYDDTVAKVQEIIKGGLSSENIEKARKLVEEKTQSLQKYAEKAWQKSLEEAKPILDKNPKLKELVESNKTDLLKGDVGQLWNKVQEASKSGNVDDVKKFVESQVNNAKESVGGGHGMESLLGGVFGGDAVKKVFSNFQELQSVAQKHGKEAEDILKSASEEIKQVLQKKVDEAKQLKNKAEKDAKNAKDS